MNYTKSILEHCVTASSVALIAMLLANLQAHASKPDMVIVLADDHAFEAVSAYGSPHLM